MPENTPKTANPMSTLNGGELITVTKLDGSNEEIFVKQLPVRQYQKYLEAQADEVKMIVLACNKPEEFCDTLTPDSHELLVTTIERMNESFFQHWLQRQKNRVERLFPGAQEKVVEALQTTLPKPPLSVA